MPHVQSSMMTFVKYDDDAGELDITFASGKTYRYLEVPSEIYDGLLDAESKGKFFNDNIKDAFVHSEVMSRRNR
jgi:KTSC domain